MKELLKELIKIPSPSRDEGAVADFLEAYMLSKGLDVHRKGHNLWVESEPFSENRPTILLNAHIDTVKPVQAYSFNPFEPFEKDGAIFGLGSNDDGGSLVTLLFAYMELVKRPQPYRLVFSATAEEEVSGVGGIEMIFDEIGPIALGIIGEPTGMRPAVAEKGLMVLDCTSFGKSGHAARNEGVNAIYEALPDIDWFRNYTFERVSEYNGAVKMSVTQINAGTQHNVVPAECKFVVDVRNNGMYTNPELLSLIKQKVKCAVKERSVRLNGSSIDVSHPFVQKCVSMGLEPFGSPTTSNQSLCHFTTVKIGPGDSSRSHTADEYILEKELSEGLSIFVKLLDGLDLN